ncbi:MAG: hydrogenase formation protein HypD [Aureliella sp.]
MKYVDEYRDPKLAQDVVDSIRTITTRRWVLMDVCGGQTHGLLRYGIEDELSDCVELIHGPGCPVCVTPAWAIDFAQDLSLTPGVLLASFGDMLRVPGSHQSLLDARSRGGQLQIVYSPLDAVELARTQPDKHIVFFGVGFETTAPSTALAVLQAERLRLNNFSVLVSHVRVLPAMEALMLDPDQRIQAFLAAGHVCTIAGFEEYDSFCQRFNIPVVITGFEPVDLLNGILRAVGLLEQGQSQVVNCYARIARRTGNATAQEIVSQVYEVVNCEWRGFGTIPSGGLCLRERFQQFDASLRFSEKLAAALPKIETTVCQSGAVMAGRIKPSQCPHFGKECTPDRPLGAPMVSSEGACAAYFRYQ